MNEYDICMFGLAADNCWLWAVEAHNASDIMPTTTTLNSTLPIPSTRDLTRWVLNGPLTTILCFIGSIFNLLIILIFRKPSRNAVRKSTGRRPKIPMINLYLLAVAMWDVLLLIGAVLMYSIPTLYFVKLTVFTGTYTYILPYAYAISNTALSGTMWMMVLLTFDRYLAIVRPLKHKITSTRSYVYRLLVVASVMVILIRSPDWFRLTVSQCVKLKPSTCKPDAVVPYIDETAFASTEFYSFWYRIMGGLLTYSALPPVALLYLTFRITVILARAMNSRAEMTNHINGAVTTSTIHLNQSGEQDSTDQSVFRLAIGTLMMRRRSSDRTADSTDQAMGPNGVRGGVLASWLRGGRNAKTIKRVQFSSNSMHFAVIFKFIICRSLTAVLDIMEKLDKESFDRSTTTELLITLSNLLVVIHSSTNLLVYIYFSASVRQSLKELVTCWLPADPKHLERKEALYWHSARNHNLTTMTTVRHRTESVKIVITKPSINEQTGLIGRKKSASFSGAHLPKMIDVNHVEQQINTIRTQRMTKQRVSTTSDQSDDAETDLEKEVPTRKRDSTISQLSVNVANV